MQWALYRLLILVLRGLLGVWWWQMPTTWPIHFSHQKTICCSACSRKTQNIFFISLEGKLGAQEWEREREAIRNTELAENVTWDLRRVLTIKKHWWNFKIMFGFYFVSASVISRFESHQALVCFVLCPGRAKTPPKAISLKSECEAWAYLCVTGILISKFIAVTWHRSMALRRRWSALWSRDLRSVEKRKGAARRNQDRDSIKWFHYSQPSEISDGNSRFSTPKWNRFHYFYRWRLIECNWFRQRFPFAIILAVAEHEHNLCHSSKVCG